MNNLEFIIKFKWVIIFILATFIYTNTHAQCTGECIIEHEYYTEVHTILPFNNSASLITVGVTNNVAYYQGDIVLGNINELLVQEDDVLNGVAIDNISLRWENATIPYETGNFSNAEIQKINEAAKHISDNTNLCVVPRTNETDYVFVRSSDSGCSSVVGKIGGQQFITLSQDCSFGSTVHEFLHAAGVYHEQSRSDRDEYISININNVRDGYERNFDKRETNATDYGSYNYESIMHYGNFAFAVNSQTPTIVTIPPGIPIGQRDGLSSGDILTLNTIYPIACGSPEVTSQTNCQQRDRTALTEVYNSLNGNTWPESTQWDFNQPMNTWNGVTLDGNGCVYSLNLPNLGIQGILPTEIGNLSEIRSINLFNNNIGGEIPTSIGNLTNLKKLNLYSNQLTGIIPSTIGNLQKLELITLASNKFEGNIPEWLTNMNALINITLRNNKMSGCYASSLNGLCNQLSSYSNNNAKISNGNNFDASWEDFCTNQAGSCNPTSTCRQTDSLALIKVHEALNGNTWPESAQWDFNQPMNTWNGVTLDGNGCVYSLNLPNLGIQGILPTEIGNLSEIRSINLFNNNIGGEIPTSIGNLTNLKKLNLYSNQLTGIIPSTIGNLQKLELITLASNKFEGNIPEWLTNMNALINITLRNNKMSGCYASSLNGLCNQLSSYSNNNAKISNGNNFDASWEDFCTNQAGSCDPTSTCRQADSLALIKVYEALDGESWCTQCNGDFSLPMNEWYGITLNANGCVDKIFMNDASISGTLATEIGDLSEITEIDLMQNQISGNIPSSIGNLSKLKNLYLGFNQLTGTIPSSIGELANLETLSLFFNQLEGTIPSSIGNLFKLKTLHLYLNQLEGTIPSTIGNLSKLENLSLSDNQLTGTIPSTIGDLLNLKSMTLKNNQLNGCYDSNLFQLCDRLYPYFSSNTQISNGNNFGLSWESFCNDKYCGDKLSSPNNLTIGNYPNPFRAETTISFTLDEASEVRVTVYNVLGEQIEVLLNNKLQAKGKQSITFDGTNLPAGIYYCKIKTGAHDDLRKMILMK